MSKIISLNCTSQINEECKIFAIGDPHFMVKDLAVGAEFVKKIIALVHETQPDIIIVLGDILDTHEMASVFPHKLACNFLYELSKRAPTVLLIGNHDLINPTQFQTDNHFFTPFKLWKHKDLYVIDTAKILKWGDNFNFAVCPYVPPGRFIEALNTAEKWDTCDAVFGHQEIRGCMVDNGKISGGGDVWCSDYPPLICGHIHKEQIVGTNVYYPGAPLQHTFGENCTKYVWLITFDMSEFGKDHITKLETNLRLKKTIPFKYGQSLEEITKESENNHVKIAFDGTEAEYKVFRESNEFQKVQEKGVKLVFKGKKEAIETIANSRDSIIDTIKNITATKPANVQQALVLILSQIDTTPI